MRIRSQSLRREGQVIILLAVSMVSLMGVLALSLDAGGLRSEDRHGQATADAAAIAGGGQLFYEYYVNRGLDKDGTVRNVSLKSAAQNGYSNDGIRTNVTIHIPPISGNYVNRPGFIEVITEYNYPRGFSAIFGSGDLPVRNRSVAVGLPVAADVGILVLDPAAKDAFGAGGGGIINIYDAPVIVNSSNIEGSISNGGTVITAPEYNLVGGYAEIGGGVFNGTINLNRNPTEDPLSYLPLPDASTMTLQSRRKIQRTQGAITLQPGVYDGGINVSGSASLTLEPGIYYMKGGGFSFSGQGSLTGKGVMIYNDPGNGNSDGVNVTGQGVIDLTPLETGIYQGITFFQNRNSAVTGEVSGNGFTSIKGTFYFANALLNISGNGGVVNIGSQYISRKLNLGGNGTIIIQWDPTAVAKRRLISIVE